MKEIREGCEIEVEKLEKEKSRKKHSHLSKIDFNKLDNSLPRIPVRVKNANKTLDHRSIVSHSLRYKLMQREKEAEREEERKSYVANSYSRSED